MKRNWRDYLIRAAPVATGLLLTLAFEPFDKADAAWCAFVPLLIACAFVGPKRAITLGWQAGMVFWITSMWWLTRVTVFGWLLLCAYISLYFIPIALVSAWWFARFGVQRFLKNAAFMVLVASVWVASEYARLNLFTGFPWNPLGATQYANISFLQHASWGGVYPAGAMLVWCNSAIAVTILRYLTRHARLGRTPHPELMIGMVVVVAAFWTGAEIAKDVDVDGREMRVALVQPAIPQEDKWTPDQQEVIYDRLRDLTASAVSVTKPDLVVWPETSLPDDLLYSERSYELVDGLSRLGSPLLVGSMDAEYVAGQHPVFFNSSFLFNTNGMAVQKYDKRHLVLLGEYVPLHQYIRFITAMTPLAESFSPGLTSTVFRLPDREWPFASLICFEDTVGYLGRDSVKNGARLIVNQTNDAWFDPSGASRQHLALAVFRCVENRVPMVRSANTGYTCAIDARGKVQEILTMEEGRHDGSGFLLATVHLPPDIMEYTFYTRHGDVFAWACIPLGLFGLTLAWRARNASPGI